MLDLEDPSRVYDAGDVLRRDGACEQRGRFGRDDGRWDQPGEVFGACAGAALYRRRRCSTSVASTSATSPTWRTSTCALRLRLAGWSCRYEPVVALHAGEGSSHRLPGGHLYFVARNTLMLVAKAFPPRWLPLVAYRQLAGRGTRYADSGCRGTCEGRRLGSSRVPRALRARRLAASRWRCGRVPVEEVVPARPITGSAGRGHPA